MALAGKTPHKACLEEKELQEIIELLFSSDTITRGDLGSRVHRSVVFALQVEAVQSFSTLLVLLRCLS